jgi:sec-independent protein translocase protein TatA
MPSLGPAEVLVILVVALLVFGPKRMPEIGRQVARGVREFRRVQQHLHEELQGVVGEFDPDRRSASEDFAPNGSNGSNGSAPGGDPVPTLGPKDVDEPMPGAASDDPAANAPEAEASGAPATDPAPRAATERAPDASPNPAAPPSEPPSPA